MDILPNDPLLVSCSREELLFAAHWKRKHLSEIWDNVARMLGVRWKPEDVHAQHKPQKSGPDKPYFEFPLALAVNPQLNELLKKVIPKPKAMRDTEDLNEAMGFDVIRTFQRRKDQAQSLASKAKALLAE